MEFPKVRSCFFLRIISATYDFPDVIPIDVNKTAIFDIRLRKFLIIVPVAR